jgi:hypothetical protein
MSGWEWLGLICFYGGVAVPTVILLASLFRIACGICGVDIPQMSWAVLCVILVGLIGTLVVCVLQLNLVSTSFRRPSTLRVLAVPTLAAPLTVILAATVYRPLIRVTYGKALKVALAQMLLTMGVAGILTCLFSMIRR